MAAITTAPTVLVNAGPWLPVPPGGYGGIERMVAALVPELRRAGWRVVLATVGDSTVEADETIWAYETGQFPRLAAPYGDVVGIAHAHMSAVACRLRQRPDIDLVHELRRAGWRVVLATVADSTVEADETIWAYETGQFPRLAAPYGDVVGIAHAHMSAVACRLRQRPDIDLVHDHLEVVGPAVLGAMGEAAPPVLQTLHWDLSKHPEFYRSFDGGGRVFFAAVSEAQLAGAPVELRSQTVGVVPLATPSCWAAAAPAGDYVLTLGRLTEAKGFDVAARLAHRLRLRLVMAGPVGGFDDRTALEAAMADPDSPVRHYRDVRYFQCQVEPLLDGDLVRWVGSVRGEEKDRLLRHARAVVFPLRWDEPGGTAIVEALAAGVPVVGFRRGVLPSLVEHGVTGFVVDTEDELAAALVKVDELDRDACCRQAEDRFGPRRMAAGYLRLYEDVLARARPVRSRPSPLAPAAANVSTT